MLETELSTQMQEQEEADPEYRDSRNGYKPKSLKSSMGEIPISVPQDRNSDFEPQIVPKYKRDISEIEGKVISMYARGMSVRQISDQVRDIYGFDVSEGMESEISGLYEPLGGELGCNQSHVQVLGDRPEGALYHQCHREPEQRLPPSQPQPQRLPE